MRKSDREVDHLHIGTTLVRVHTEAQLRNRREPISTNGAGGGTRTHTFFRTRAPKARASRQFRHARSAADRTACTVQICRWPLLPWRHHAAEEVSGAVSGRVQRSAATHRRWHERLRNRAADGHPATDGARLAPQTAYRLRQPSASITLRRRPRLRDAPAPRRTAYLLGMYLGDGCISRMGACLAPTDRPATRSTRRSSLAAARRSTCSCPAARSDHAAPDRMRRTSRLYSKHWPCLFPQHGPGRKHNRRIALEPWQQALVDQATEEFVCGLIHSDGCRVVANDRGVRSIRYHFSNRSEDIIGLFTAALDQPRHPLDAVDQVHRLHLPQRPPRPAWTSSSGPRTVAVPWTNVHYTA